MWEHKIVLTGPTTVERTIESLELQGWQICAVTRTESGLVQLINKRPKPAFIAPPLPRSAEEDDQAFLELIEHHRQHHLRDEAQEIQPSHKQDYLGVLICSEKTKAGPKIVTIDATDLERLRAIRFRAETELQRAKKASTDWYTLRYILDITGGRDEIIHDGDPA